MAAGATVELSAAYTDNRGALRVALTPPEAVAAGAQWRRVGTETWLDSGAVEAGVPAGACQVEFQEVAGWSAPSVQTVTVAVGGTTELSATFLEAGAIRVVIAPEEVVLAGAQWRRIGTTPWHNSGAEVITPAGDWQVEYKTVAGWISPSAQPVTVAAGATSDLSAAYTDNRGALRVTITPPEAVAAGARWRRTGTTPWFDSGATETAVPAGSRQVEFRTVAGWIKPSTRSVTVSPGTTAELAVSYTDDRGALHVTITPPEAVAAGAQWRRKGTTSWFDSGTTETSVSAGNRYVEFKLVTGWAAPTQTVTVTAGATAEVVGVYAPAGSLRVTITPDMALPAGAQWRRVGTTTWRDSGFVETALPPGDFQVEFKGASGWITPPAQPVTVTLGETAEVAAAYVLYGGLQVWITPAEAVAAGAQWRPVGTTTWLSSGAMLV